MLMSMYDMTGIRHQTYLQSKVSVVHRLSPCEEKHISFPRSSSEYLPLNKWQVSIRTR